MSLVSTQRLVADSPWTRSDLRRSGIWTAVGLIALAACCVGISRTKTYDDQLLWAALGAIALAVAVLGGVRWILRGMRTVRQERRDVMGALGGLTAEEVAATDTAGVRGVLHRGDVPLPHPGLPVRPRQGPGGGVALGGRLPPCV